MNIPRSRRLIVIAFSALFFLTLLFCLSLSTSCLQRSSPEFWFDDIQNPLPLTKLEHKALLRFAVLSLSSEKNTKALLPHSLENDSSPRVIFLSISDGKTSSRVFIGSGGGMAAATKDALDRAKKRIEKEFVLQWVKLDIVQEVYPAKLTDLGMPLQLQRSLFGLAFERKTGIAFLPEELVANILVDYNQQLQPSNILNLLEDRTRQTKQIQNILNSPPILLFRFSTSSIFFDGKEIFPLYRGHRLFPMSSKEEMLQAARRGGEYLIRALDSDGKFIYSYLPKTDELEGNYNTLRHAGTVYAMLDLYEVTREKELLNSSRRALDFLLLLAKPWQGGKEKALCILDGEYVKLGGNALAIIALAKYTALTGDKTYMPIMRKLAVWIKATQAKNGRFTIHKQMSRKNITYGFESKYYPGEAILALTRLYALDPDDTLLSAAEKGAGYLISVRDKGLSLSELTHDHWLLYALNELHRYRKKPSYIDHASKIVRAILQSQSKEPEYPDWLGIYLTSPRSAHTAARVEGLCAAYRLIYDFGDAEFAQKILESIELGVRFQLQTQFRPETVMYVRNPVFCLGAFFQSLTSFKIQIDYTQHNISSLLGLYRILCDDERNSHKKLREASPKP